ncbi:MAG TPA: carbonic anhydrase family protein [Nitrospira sp.]|nr:carbonic anhydrase family protein [Nitrospira sp.]
MNGLRRSVPVVLLTMLWGVSLHAGQQESALLQSSIQWGYDGDRGPLHWGSLGQEFSLCQKGMSQSPIDLLHSHKTHLENIQFTYKAAHFRVVNNGQTLHTHQNVPPHLDKAKARYPRHGQTVLHFDKDSTIVFDGDLYLLEQFHFHVPSEHTVDQIHYPMELHLVHHNERHEVAVVAIFIEEGPHNPIFQTVLEHAPLQVGGVVDDHEHSVDPMDLLPKNQAYYRYFGSFTTPPCYEGVIWAVLQEPIQVSADQIQKFRALQGHDNIRPTQPLHKRFVLESHLAVTPPKED